MEFIGLLAPIAFIFALAAISQSTKLKDEVKQLRTEVGKIREKLNE